VIVAITGGVGSGKTVFARELGKLGARVIEADTIARSLVDENENIRVALRRAFGSEIFDDVGILQRRKLGRLAFSKKNQLEKLNKILWPPLIQKVKDQIARFKKEDKNRMVVVDIAILFEAEMESLFDTIVVITAPMKNRLKWLAKERGWTQEEAKERMRIQWDVRRKIKKADIVIANSGDLDDLQRIAGDLYSQLLQIKS